MKNIALYSMFTVNDYKGGELSTSLNKTAEKIAEELIDMGAVEYDESDLTNITIKDAEEYAGGDDGWCGEIYKHLNGKLKLVPSSFFEKAAIKVLKANV